MHERNDDPIVNEGSGNRIHIRRCCIDKAKRIENRNEKGWKQRYENPMDNSADDRASLAAHRVSENAGRAACKEIREHAGQNGCKTEYRKGKHRNNRSDRRRYKADNDRIRRKWEKNGTVERRNGIRNDLHCNAAERGDDFAEDEAYAGKKDIHANDKLNGLHKGMNKIIYISCKGLTKCLTGKERRDDVERNHDDHDGEVRILQKLECLGKLHLLHRLFRIADKFCNACL